MSKDITILVGLSETELLSIRSAAVASLTSNGVVGQNIVSTTTRDLSVTFENNTTPDVIIKACNYALQMLDPEVYGTDLIRKKTKWVC